MPPSLNPEAEAGNGLNALRRLLALCVLMGLSGGCQQPPSGGPRWNVILIVVDTLRADHLPLYGYDRPTTPSLDTNAQSAVVFLNARADSACTFPSVNSLLTSKQPQHFLKSMKEHGWGIPRTSPDSCRKAASRRLCHRRRLEQPDHPDQPLESQPGWRFRGRLLPVQ